MEIHGPLWHAEHLRDLIARVVPFGFTSRALVRQANAAAFVTHELANNSAYSVIPRKVAIGNGIELGKPAPAPRNETPIAGMAIGLDAPWNGLDVMANWAELIPGVQFVVICPAELATSLQRDPAYESLRFRATRHRDEYREELSQLDVGIGSLAAERKKVFELAALKVRDYLDVGIPTLLVTPDTNLVGIDDEAVVLGRKPMNLSFIQNWIYSMSGRRVLESTRQAVSIEAIEASRLETIQST